MQSNNGKHRTGAKHVLLKIILGKIEDQVANDIHGNQELMRPPKRFQTLFGRVENDTIRIVR